MRWLTVINNEDWSERVNGYLDDKLGRTEFKEFLDGLSTSVNDVTSSPHGSHQRSDGITFGHRPHTHLGGGRGIL